MSQGGRIVACCSVFFAVYIAVNRTGLLFSSPPNLDQEPSLLIAVSDFSMFPDAPQHL